MTRYDIMRMAREAGISDTYFDFIMVSPEDLERFAALVAAAERDALRARIEALERQEPSVPDDVRKDAERYRFLEHLCATGSYGGIISRKAIDAAMLAASPEAKP